VNFLYLKSVGDEERIRKHKIELETG